MKLSCEVNVHHLTRVEGHGNIAISIKNGVVKKAQWEVVETPRFFEAMLVGKHWENAPCVCGRICGICSIGHTLASIRAVENAFGITPSAQTANLRLLLKHMETLQSHILHLYFLAAPDFLGAGSVLPLAKSHPEVVQRALRLKLLANDACDIIGGRRLHPTRTVVGGFTMLPEKGALEKIRQRLLASVPDLLASAELFKTFAIPDFSRETEFVSLKGDTDYPFIGGDLVSSDGVVKKEEQYRAMTNEYCTKCFTSKLSKLSRPSFAVGALAAREGSPIQLGKVWALLSAAAILGDAVNYAAGKWAGPKVFSRQDSWLLNRKHLDEAHRFYEKYGGKTIILARFLPIVRTFAPFVAGIGTMSYPRFALYNVTGGLAWTTAFLLAGWKFAGLEAVKHHFHYVILAIIIISCIPPVWEVLKARRERRLKAPAGSC